MNILNTIDNSHPKFEKSIFRELASASAKQKGTIGEDITKSLLSDEGFEVTDRCSKEHDCMVNGKMVEIKTAMERKDDEIFTFYGYDPTEDPHYWVFTFISPNDIYVIKMTRCNMAEIILGKTRKNIMINVTLEDMINAGGEILVYKEDNDLM